MDVCMFVYMYVFICGLQIYKYVLQEACMHVRTYVCLYIFMFVSMKVHMYEFTYVHNAVNKFRTDFFK
jgi:hypothetical protein